MIEYDAEGRIANLLELASGMTAQDIIVAAKAFDEYGSSIEGYDNPTTYVVIVDGKSFPIMPIVAMAINKHRKLRIRSSEFRGYLKNQSLQILEQLGFSIKLKSEFSETFKDETLVQYREMLYLDAAGSTKVFDEVIEEMTYWMREQYGNPSSDHLMGERAAARIEAVREQIADAIGAYPSEIIFTSGATESNNLAIKGYCLANKKKGNHIVSNRLEHKCVLACLEYLERNGFEVTYVEPNQEGLFAPETIKLALRSDTILATFMHANNETGIIQDIAGIGKVCFEHGVRFHTDAAQSFAKVDIDVDDMNLDFLSLSGHKFGASKGIGVLYIRDARSTEITPIIHGAGQELGLRGGTLATPLIAGLGVALSKFKPIYKQLCESGYFNRFFKTTVEQLEISDGSVNFSENKISHIYSYQLKNETAAEFMRRNKDRVCVSQGSACNAMSIEPSYVLTNLGLNREQAEKTIRISLLSKEMMIND